MAKNLGKVMGEALEIVSGNLRSILPFLAGLVLGIVIGVLLGMHSNGLLQLGIGSTFTNQQRHYFNISDKEFKELTLPVE